jgi:ribonuclease I
MRRPISSRPAGLTAAVVLSLCVASAPTAGADTSYGYDRPSPNRAGDFETYLLSLAWTPTLCADHPPPRDPFPADPCSAARALGFTLRGLWPQHRRGYPTFCRSVYQPPTAAQTEAAGRIFASPHLARQEWDKHGTCSGLVCRRRPPVAVPTSRARPPR